MILVYRARAAAVLNVSDIALGATGADLTFRWSSSFTG